MPFCISCNHPFKKGMAGLIPPEFIDELLARVDIVEVIEPVVHLKKSGQNYSGLCPFHKEKTPSFSVSQDKQFYYCFGCHATGKAHKFLMEHDGLDFVSAIEQLAARVGMEVPRQSGGELPEHRQRRNSLYEVLLKATEFYKMQLKKHETKSRAVDYLLSRGLKGIVAKDFAIGYAPAGWDNLHKALATSNADRDLLIEAGMIIENEEEKKTYDRFRDRIMFPIRDIRGRVIAFGGRVLGDGKPKYLNSPETPIFKKGRELYGLYETRRSGEKLKRLVVVEGYMDVVALAQHGVKYAVATLGTATSHHHMERLYRLVSEVVFCFDGDDAGRNAAWKALNEALPLLKDGRAARFLFLPDGEDPDTIVRKEGKTGFESRLSKAQALPDFCFNHLTSEIDMSSMEGKAKLSTLAMPLINRIPEGVFRQLMVDRLATLTGLERERLLKVTHVEAPHEPPPWLNMPEEGDAIISAPARIKRDSLSEIAIGHLLREPALVLEIADGDYHRLESSGTQVLLCEIVDLIRQDIDISPLVLLSHFQDRPQFDLLRNLAEREHLLPVENITAEYKGVIARLLDRLEDQSFQGFKEKLPTSLDQLSDEDRSRLQERFSQKG